jgi:hypothetical protein
MSYQATKNMFQLMKLLSRDRSYSIIEIEDLLEIDERTFHRYQNAMAEIGFKLNCIDGYYIQNKESSTFTIANFSKRIFESSFILKNENKINLVKVYNLLMNVEVKELPVNFESEFIQGLQEFYLK